MLANSKEGKELIDKGMKYTKSRFNENLKDIKKFIQEYSKEELFEEKILDKKKLMLNKLQEKKSDINLSFFRYSCNCIGEYRGSNIWIYDNDGEGITNNEHLKNVLDKWGKATTEFKNLKIYVLPVDVHS